MKTFAATALVAIATAQVNQVSIDWTPATVEDWAIEWDQRYQPIEEGWANLMETTAMNVEWTASNVGW